MPVIIAADLGQVRPRRLIAHRGIRRLFAMVHENDVYSIIRIDPFSGRVELHWVIDDDYDALMTPAGDNKLLVTYYECIQEYSVDGQLLRTFVSALLDNPDLLQSTLHHDSTITVLYMIGNGFPIPIPSHSHMVNSHSFQFPFPIW